MQANRSARSPRPVSVCSFTFADGRQCRMPRRQGHPYLCLFHAKKEAQLLAGEQASQDIASFLSGNYISACDVAKSLARLFSAVAQGHIKPKTAATLAYLGQTLVQTLKLAQDEYINAFGTPAWRQTIASSFSPPPAPPQRPAPPPTSPKPQPPPPSSVPPPASAAPHSVAKPTGESLDSSPSSPTEVAAIHPTPQPRPAQPAAQPNSIAVNPMSAPTSSPLLPSSPRSSAGGAAQVSPARQRWGTRQTRPQHRRCGTNPWTATTIATTRLNRQRRRSNSFRINTYKSV